MPGPRRGCPLHPEQTAPGCPQHSRDGRHTKEYQCCPKKKGSLPSVHTIELNLAHRDEILFCYRVVQVWMLE